MTRLDPVPFSFSRISPDGRISFATSASASATSATSSAMTCACSCSVILSSIVGVATPDGSGPDGSVERASRRPVRAWLALLPLLILTACAIEPQAARDALRDEGYEHVETSAEPAFGRPCDWSEPYARHFVANRDGRRVAGTLCSTTEAAHDAQVRGARIVASRAPAWDAFGGGR